jgi:hypothetical protein
MNSNVAVAGAGVYGSTIAIRLAECGHRVRLFDPLGVLRAASAINQCRIHSGYHYPRSPETILETMRSRAEFLTRFAAAIVPGTSHYYAIPKEGSLTSPDSFERIMGRFGLPLRACRPPWMNFEFIDKCYEADEHLYDPDLLRDSIVAKLAALGVPVELRLFDRAMRDDFDFVVWATYGLGHGGCVFNIAKYQVAEKVLIDLPPELQGVSLVVVDGPFTAFDPYGRSGRFLFGSAKQTNHWTSLDRAEPVPMPFAPLLNRNAFEPVTFTRFEAMRRDAAISVPAARNAVYRGSRFTLRVVENDSEEDRRTLYVKEGAPGELHVFSGKVACAVEAARIVCERVSGK